MMMKVVVITHPTNGMVAVVENPGGVMSPGAVAVAWSRSEGFGPPVAKTLKLQEMYVTSYGTVQRKLTPCHELDALDELGKALSK